MTAPDATAALAGVIGRYLDVESDPPHGWRCRYPGLAPEPDHCLGDWAGELVGDLRDAGWALASVAGVAGRLHEGCQAEWRGREAESPGAMPTQHGPDAHEAEAKRLLGAGT